ncbi:hypothetical protein Salat_1739800 [Sesamum alatum]|uniref:Uncharacterized protein n=1 Tax=Sesamum alatum TaxID=300844 RepID=A0AAE1Y9C4_9LAMI|nr:hypothetical protein Salat_1739800 [Sesamum alatum]
MFFTCQKQFTCFGSNGGHEFRRLVEISEKSPEPRHSVVRKIRRLQEPSENDGQAKTDSGNVSVDNAPTPLKEGLPKFGPFYFDDDHILLKAREDAWDRVLGKIGPANETKKSTEESEKIKQEFFSAIRDVEKDAMETYVGGFEFTKSDFRLMMIKDGCFFLQLALLVLGGPEPLGYPPNHVIFGRDQSKKKMTLWLDSMFYVGNQIPVVVLRELMRRKFFQQLLTKGKWDQPSVLSERVLYEVLLLPFLPTSVPDKGFSQLICCRGRKKKDRRPCTLLKDQPPPTDVLEGLRRMILGPDQSRNEEYEPDDMDLEANWRENTSEEKRKINAVSLRIAGIQIRHIPGVGSRGIHFKGSNWGSACLYLPTFTVDNDTELILQNVKAYEISQPLGKNEREVCSYLRFMGDIIRTLEDVNLLARRGIIHGSQRNMDKLPGILKRLDSKDLTQHLYRVKLQMSSYSCPAWRKHLKKILSIVAVLTILQTAYAIVSYHHPRKC